MANAAANLGLPPPPGYGGLTVVAAAVMFVGALALGVAFAADGVARHWSSGDESRLTVQVPMPGGAAEGGITRRDAVLAVLRATPGVAAARAVSEGELADLLRPFLGSSAESLSLPLPGVIELRLAGDLPDPAGLAAQLAARAPGTMMEREAAWLQPVRQLLRRLQWAAFAGLAATLLAGSAALVACSRAGLAARTDIARRLHALGAGDRFIGVYLAAGSGRQAALGAVAGGLLALVVLFLLACLTATLAGVPGWPDILAPATLLPGSLLSAPWRRLGGDIPPGFWAGLIGLGVWNAVLAWAVARWGLRRWLWRLP